MDFKLIKDTVEKNKNDFTDEDTLMDFISDYNYNEPDLEDLEDNISEYADGLVPIYYNEIVKEWQENGECHEMTKEVAGEYAPDSDIYAMMSSDLFYHYEQVLHGDFSQLLSIMEEIEEGE